MHTAWRGVNHAATILQKKMTPDYLITDTVGVAWSLGFFLLFCFFGGGGDKNTTQQWHKMIINHSHQLLFSTQRSWVHLTITKLFLVYSMTESANNKHKGKWYLSILSTNVNTKRRSPMSYVFHPFFKELNSKWIMRSHLLLLIWIYNSSKVNLLISVKGVLLLLISSCVSLIWEPY